MYTIPSSKPSSVKMDASPIPTNLRDSLSCLDVVWSDMFETGDSATDSMKHETDFLKGAPPQWLCFSPSENSPFVERDGFKDLIQLIKEKKRKRCLITEVSLPYQPGSGGSTLAMQVLWHFHKDLRCAKVIDSDLDDKKLPKQVVDLFLLSNEQHAKHDPKTVLLLLDTKENSNNDQPIKNSLWENLIDEMRKRDISTDSPAVIILNCRTTTVRATGRVEITMMLSPNEKERFDKKKLELNEKYKTMSETFHAFNIMQGGFRKEDAEKLITAEIVQHVKKYPKSKSTRLLSFLALINSYVPGSQFSKLLCEEFIAQTDRHSDEENVPLETIMKPFIDLIVIFSAGKPKTDYIRMAHPMIADACVNMLTNNKLTRFNIASDFLQSMVKGKESDYMRICKRLLTMRVDTETYKFSQLIIHLMMNHEECIELLNLGSNLFTNDPFYPQALARLYYIEVKQTNKYNEAENFANKAIARAPEKSHIRDTLGQVHKNHLRTILKENTNTNTETVLDIAKSAVKAFKEEEKAAERESEDISSFNNRGYFGCLQVCKIIYDFSAENPLEQKYSRFISGLRGDVEKRYDFFEWYLAFSRPSINKNDPDYLHNDIEECYKRYFAHETQTDEATLNEKKMKSFAGLLHFPESDMSVLKQNQSAFQNPQSDDETQNVLYVSANIILSMFDEESEKIEELQASLQKLWLSKEKRKNPEFYLLILLLFWFNEGQPRIPNPPDLENCVLYMRESYEKSYQKYLRGRYLVPLFFFGEGNGLQRLLHSSKLHPNDSPSESEPHPNDSPDWLELLLEGDVKGLQRISGEVKKNHKVFANRDGKQIQVTPHKPASVYKPGQVSFYLGFNIRGPVAFNIRYVQSM
ncbi:sterile alpha motif domain-containing protein 9-like [Siphateles boraxobius]|uniref:sterile alpha motif domain-containing protein 9-like n=1 Tax=Siphateles boraxobius TaxID=180520 RepID=UPI0040636547